jgi:lipopolysaccharide/colanic/teichoic acid biosynthesis glycosyltransferase
MLKNAERMEGGEITRKNDPRVLPLGKFLRKTKINELPQLSTSSGET